MTFHKRISFAARVASLMLLVFAVGCSREDAPSRTAVPSRAEDPEYREQLEKHIASQRKVAHDINSIDRMMELQRKRARAAIGEDATEAQILAELESKPLKYPEWSNLVGRRKAAEREMKKRRDETRAAVLARIAEEKNAAQSATAETSEK